MTSDIYLYINSYKDPDKKRRKELKEASYRNESLYCITKVIYLFGKPTFNDFFKEANEQADINTISIIANADIYFNDTLKHAFNIQPDECYALSRWDLTDGKLQHFNVVDSQDAWIFRGKIKPVSAPFGMGIPGCDNRLAHELEMAGYKVTNPSKQIQAVHLHSSNVRRWDRNVEVIQPPYKLLMPT